MTVPGDAIKSLPVQTFARLAAHRIDRARQEPLWSQIRGMLDEMILDGTLRPNDQLPSEYVLGTLLGVSRPVIREALAALERDGLIVKISRRGVFVSEPRNELDFAGSNVGLFGDLTSKGHEVTTQDVELGRVAPTAHQRSGLGLPKDIEVVRLRRVYQIDGRPIAFGTLLIPADRAPGLERINFESKSFYATIQAHFGIVVSRAERWLEAVVVTGEDAVRLQLEPGTAAVRIESIGWTADGKAVEYYNTVYNTQLSRIHLRTVSMPPPTPAWERAP